MTDLLALTRLLAETPGLTFHEEPRAALMADLFAKQGAHPERDGVGNVLARFGPRGVDPLCIAAHLDSVLPPTPEGTRVEGDRLLGAGVADDCAGLAILVQLAGWAAGQTWQREVFLLADVGEEGLGDLRGVRGFLAEHPDTRLFVSLDGRLGSIVCQGIGVRRLELKVHTAGGHSWGDFGRPSAVHALVRGLAAVMDIRLPERPRTTLNIGLVEGGTAVNAIAAEARALLDLRSTSPQHLDTLEGDVRRALARALPRVAHSITLVGERPAGSLPRDHMLVQRAVQALAAVGVEAEFTAGSTDANLPLARGIPAIAFGVVEARGAHTPAEELSIPSLVRGYRAAQTLLPLLAGSPVSAPSVPHEGPGT